jgi:hypothetical protein
MNAMWQSVRVLRIDGSRPQRARAATNVTRKCAHLLVEYLLPLDRFNELKAIAEALK